MLRKSLPPGKPRLPPRSSASSAATTRAVVVTAAASDEIGTFSLLDRSPNQYGAGADDERLIYLRGDAGNCPEELKSFFATPSSSPRLRTPGRWRGKGVVVGEISLPPRKKGVSFMGGGGF